MIDSKTKFLLSSAVIFVALGFLFLLGSQNTGKLRLVFCDVGQGDGILVISPSGRQAVVDGGPGNKMVDCLGKYMPFWDRTVEFMVATHPQTDHLEGLVGVLENYQVKTIATTGVFAKIKLFEVWQKAIGVEGAKIYTPNIGDTIVLDRGSTPNGPVTLTVLWPPNAFASEWQASPPNDLNETGIVTRLDYGGFCAYLTADIPKEILEKVVDKKCDLLKIAHHGSRTGTSEAVVSEISPKIAVIQNSKNNSYGHPHKEVLDILISKDIQILRNDTDGTVVVEVSEKGAVSY